MFLSKEDLKLGYGVDLEIGKFLVDRKVPVGNLYWKKRLLYLLPMPGYIFIPLFTDIEFRLGLPKSELLSEEHFQLVESILHSAATLEFTSMSFEEHIRECVELTRPVCRNPAFLQDLIYYFGSEKEKASIALGTPFKALNRADAYLFSLCYFPFNDETKKKLIDAWYALISYYLIIDDLEDIRSDFEKNEENAILESALQEESVQKIKDLMARSFEIMSGVNPVLANRIEYKNQVTDINAIIASFLLHQKK
jgi:hypothetical protein